MEQLQGEITRIIFRNDENGWTVLELIDESGDETTVVGSMPLCAPGERVALTGMFVEHKSYGRQFKAETCASLAPATLSALESYLSSGLIKGVGAATARSIIAHFGMDSLRILEEEPKRLQELPGIGRSKAATIAASFFEQRALRDVMMGMQAYGITVRQAMRLYQIYGPTCLQRVEEDPYRLIEDVEGIGFKTADKIAMRMGIEPDSHQRLRAGVLYMLIWARQEGHTYLPQDILLTEAAAMLGVPQEYAEEALDSLLGSGLLHHAVISDSPGSSQNELGLPDEEIAAIYTPSMYYMEADCARRLLSLATAPSAITIDVNHELSELERTLGIALAPEQRVAVTTALSEGAMVITGGPGTGKTTIIQFILRIMERLGLDFALCAPTGRAAKRMTEATGVDAATIHRLLEYGGEGQPVFARNEENPLYYDMVVVDEMSMVDLALFFALLRALPHGTRLIMVGDADQLPPVGAGTVLHDMIKSELLPVVRLTDIYRQSDRSGIAKNAHRINLGEAPVIEADSDFLFLPCSTPEQALNEVIKLCAGEGLVPVSDAYKDMQVLAPMKKGSLGVHALNARIQQRLNPPAPHKAQREYQENTFREGDKVMQIRNDYKLEWIRPNAAGSPELGAGVYNGDLGTILRMDLLEQTLDVLFDDERLAQYTFSQLDELELAYCISIHKSQGSEFPLVVLPLFNGPPVLMTRNLLYTAVTRARAQVVIIGNWKSVLQMVENKRTRRRYSALHTHMVAMAHKLPPTRP